MEGKEKIFPIEIGKGKLILIFKINSEQISQALGISRSLEEKKDCSTLLTDKRNIVISYTWLLNGFRTFYYYTKIISTK